MTRGKVGVIDASRETEQRAPDHDSRVVAPNMGERARADAFRIGDVARRVDDPVGETAQAAVGRYARARGSHISGVEPEILQVGRAPGRHEKMASREGSPILQHQFRAGANFGNRRVLDEIDALTLQDLAQSADQLGILLAGDRSRLDYGDVAAEPGMGLRHFQSDRPAAEDQQVGGPFLELEQRLVGEKRHLCEPRDGRNGGPAARGDHDAAGGDPVAAHLQRIRRDEAGVLAEHRGAERPIARLRIVGGDRGDGAMHVRADGGPVDHGLGQAYP